MMKIRRWWRTYQIEVCDLYILLLGYSENRIAYSITSLDHVIFISPDPTVTILNGDAVPVNSTRTFTRIGDNETRSFVYAIGPTAEGDTVTVREDFEEVELP